MVAELGDWRERLFMSVAVALGDGGRDPVMGPQSGHASGCLDHQEALAVTLENSYLEKATLAHARKPLRIRI